MKTVLRNLHIAFPENSIVRNYMIAFRFYLHILKNFFEWLRLDSYTFDDIKAMVDLEVSEETIRSWVNRRPLFFCTGHVGNWELANLLAEYYVGNYGVLVKEQRGLFKGWLAKKREKRNIRIWYVGRDEKEMLRSISHMAAGIVIDHGVKDGIRTKFFNKACFFPKGLVWFVKKKSVQLLPTFVVRDVGRLKAIVKGPPVDLSEKGDEEIARIVTRYLEEVVRDYPCQYLWTFKRWKYSWQLEVCVLTDGRPGHIRQTMALVEYLRLANPDKEIIVHKIDVSSLTQSYLLRALMGLVAVLPRFVGEWIVSHIVKDKAGLLLNKPYDLIISTGSSLSGLNVFLKRYNFCSNVCVMDPGWGMRSYFDRMFVPRHDGIKGRGIVQIDGALAYFDESQARAYAESLGIEKARIAILIGGDSRAYQLPRKEFLAFIEKVMDLIETSGLSALATTSRRTPLWVEEALKSRRKLFKRLVIAREENPSGTVWAFFYRTDYILVTPDSISMVSEAISSGKQVLIWSGDIQGLPKKHRLFIESLLEEGMVRGVSDIRDLEAVLARDNWGNRINFENKIQNILKYLRF